MFDSFFCDTLNGHDCFDFDGDGPYYCGSHYCGSHYGGPHQDLPPIVAEVTVLAFTRKAFLIGYGSVIPEGWYPRSQVTLGADNFGPAVISVPAWLVAEKRRSEVQFETID